jgi:hypothetical protein
MTRGVVGRESLIADISSIPADNDPSSSTATESSKDGRCVLPVEQP